MKTKHCLILAFLFIASACNQKDSGIIEVKDSKTLIPEGIAVNPINGEIYLSSLHLEKIVTVDRKGNMQDLIETNQYGFLSGIGMTVMHEKLYAVSNSLDPSPGETFIFVLEPESEELISKYRIRDTLVHLFNDLAVTLEGRIFVTDTYSNAVYSIEEKAIAPTLFLRSPEIRWPNGIALSEDEQLLYVASTSRGIRTIDIGTAEILSPADSGSMYLDGLQYYKNSLIGIQNGGKKENHRVLRFYLDESGKNIIKTGELLRDDPHFDVPTTLDVIDDKMYILANSQLRNLDQQQNLIKDTSILSNVFVLIREID